MARTQDSAPIDPIRLRVVLRTPHGEPIPGARLELMGGGAVVEAVESEQGYALGLPREGDYQLRVRRYGYGGGFDHRTLRQVLFYLHDHDGPVLRSLAPPPEQRSRIEAIRRLPDPDGPPLFEARITLDYLWFSHLGTPPRLGNRVELLVDGEEGWGAVARAIRQAQERVHLTTWMYQPTLELERPDPLAPPRVRERTTVHHLLEDRAADGVDVRLLIWDAPVLRMQRDARAAARESDDHFEVMEEANATERSVIDAERFPLAATLTGRWQIGSMHQKTCIVDGRIGFCGGMNLKENDWDRRRHELFDPARSRFRRNRTFRENVQSLLRIPDHRPRHDFVARVEGPCVRDLDDNFRERWNGLLDSGARFSESASPAPRAPEQPRAGELACQVLRTMPSPPYAEERGILDVHLRALRNARKLIYIEDQYFRSTHVSDAIAQAVRTWPGLHVVVVTVESYARDPLAGGWTQECFERIADRFAQRGEKWNLHTLRVFGREADGPVHFEEIDNHAKLMIVDDLFLTVGSCNINDRGFEYEGEINLAVVDAEWVKAQRLQLWREHLADDPRLTGDIDEDVRIWKEHARDNAAFHPERDAAPRSQVFPFVANANRNKLVGYDVT